MASAVQGSSCSTEKVERLLDFKPLTKISVPGVGELPCQGLTLLVGPNSSGKSQFLRDIYLRLSGQPRTLVVASEIQLQKPADYASFIHLLESEGYLETFVDEVNQSHLRPRTTYTGTAQAVPQIQTHQAQAFYQSYDPVSVNFRTVNTFLNHFGRLLVTALFLENRLNSLNAPHLIDFKSQPPQHDFHVLHNNDSARAELAHATTESFGRAVWTDLSTGSSLCLRVSEGPLPSAEDRHSTQKMAAYRRIEEEGDGLKAYVAICVALLLGRRPICVIDEPEMCLHPPQAYNLGRFIGSHASSTEAATFVATHSSQILRGVIQSNKEIEIIRMTRRKAKFLAHRLPAETLVEALRKPSLRAESVLDGIFSESVVVVEADGDRLVYQTAWERLSAEVKLDVDFATVGGRCSRYLQALPRIEDSRRRDCRFRYRRRYREAY